MAPLALIHVITNVLLIHNVAIWRSGNETQQSTMFLVRLRTTQANSADLRLKATLAGDAAISIYSSNAQFIDLFAAQKCMDLTINNQY